MAKPQIPRDYWSCAELQAHWKMPSDLDLRRAIMAGSIRPAAFFNRKLHPAMIRNGVPMVNTQEQVAVQSWLWPAQERSEQIDNFECVYALLRDRPQDGPEVTYWAMPEAMSLTQLLLIAVVFDSNIRALEGQRQRADRALDPREENTRDRLLVALSMECVGWDPAAEQSTGITELVRIADACGLPVSYPTAKEHMRLAWDRCKPKLAAEGDKTTEYKPQTVGAIN